MDLDLRQVRYFVAVADELHFGRAAATLFISQPALSKQVRKLEEQLGAALFVRNSRNVALTVRGQQFLLDARRLLDLASSMQQPSDPETVRVAHIHELGTSRALVDAYTSASGAGVVERVLDSNRQLEALLGHRLDVGILRVTPAMLTAHPTGWQHRLLRLEPLRLVGRPGEPPRPTASLYERPLEVFADSPGSGMYNAHGGYLSAFEERADVALRWLGNPGAFSHCLSQVSRAPGKAYLLEFDSYAERYGQAGLPVHDPEEVQPCYPWSLAWRDETPTAAVARFLETSLEAAHRKQWLTPVSRSFGEPWFPAADAAAAVR